MSKELTREQAIRQLYQIGELSYKLRGIQKEIRENIYKSDDKIQVIVSGRRSGKSFTLCLIAIELCIRKPGTIVKYACPRQRMVKGILRPIFRTILEDCPKELAPEWKEADKMYVFPNGSEIQIAGTDSENAENLRGSAADFAILDEAGFMSELKYVVRSILSPILKTRNGKMILASTPSKSANHEFITEFMEPFVAANKTKIYTIFDNPNLSDDIKKEIVAEYPRGVEDPEYRREYLCELPNNSDKSILPSFSAEIQQDIITNDYVRPPYFDAYVGMDLGFTDLTVVVFAYYDYMNACLVVEDEIVLEKMNTDTLAKAIAAKEKQIWTSDLGFTVTPYMRVSDNNLIVINDLHKLHGLNFKPTKKDNREAAINALDVAIAQKKVLINPRCKTLIYHMKFAEWNNARSDLKRLKDSIDGVVKGGHADGLMALCYLYRNVIKSRNPFPSSYGQLQGNVFQSNLIVKEEKSNLSILKKAFGLSKKK